MRNRQKMNLIIETSEGEVIENYENDFGFVELSNPIEIYTQDYDEELILEYNPYDKKYDVRFITTKADSGKNDEFSYLFPLTQESDDDTTIYIRSNKNKKLFFNINGENFFIVDFEIKTHSYIDQTIINVIKVDEKEIDLVDEEFIKNFIGEF